MLKKSKIGIFFCSFIFLSIILSSVIFAEPKRDVVLLVEGQTSCEITNKQIAVQIDIVFNKDVLINESLMLSYHIYGENDKLLLFEGNRTPLNAFVSNAIHGVPVTLNLDEIEELKGHKKIVVEFDIVDEKNLYWFSSNEEIQFASAKIIYDNSLFKQVKRVGNEILSNPLLLITNLAIYCICIFGFVIYKKRQ